MLELAQEEVVIAPLYECEAQNTVEVTTTRQLPGSSRETKTPPNDVKIVGGGGFSPQNNGKRPDNGKNVRKARLVSQPPEAVHTNKKRRYVAEMIGTPL